MSHDDYRALEKEWYAKLARAGFRDIENTDLPGRPLKTYHSTKFSDIAAQVRQSKRVPYQYLIDEFSNKEGFNIVCKLISKSSRKDKSKVKRIWARHCSGATERVIAMEVEMSKTAVHKVIEKFRKWMTIVN